MGIDKSQSGGNLTWAVYGYCLYDIMFPPN